MSVPDSAKSSISHTEIQPAQAPVTTIINACFAAVTMALSLASVNPTCSDDLLLRFPFEDHYNDVTCHGAVATQYGEGVERKFDAERHGTVACLSGKTHFEVGSNDMNKLNM